MPDIDYDLNAWVLAYGFEELEFGNLDKGYPFSVQLEIDEIERETEDTRHPSSDGVVMGLDSLGGFTMTFTLTTIPEFPLSDQPWTDAMDAVSLFHSAWRADQIRRVPGSYATLTNRNREKLVYGRPRKFAPKYTNARRGLIGYVATFDTNGPDFYSSTEKYVQLDAAGTVSTGGIKSPLVGPLTTNAGEQQQVITNNEGDVVTWPVIEFHGPSNMQSLELLDSDGERVWTLAVHDRINFDQVLTVDTRPWSRSATINGKPANGRIRGAQLELCNIPVGEFDFRYKVNDPSGTAFVKVLWRDAFASL